MIFRELREKDLLKINDSYYMGNETILEDVVGTINDYGDENCYSMGAEENGELLGAICVFSFDDDSIINNPIYKNTTCYIINGITTFEGNGNKGIGRYMVEEFSKILSEDFEGDSCYLFADALHEGVFGFYEKLGFEKVPSDKYMYRKRIGGRDA